MKCLPLIFPFNALSPKKPVGMTQRKERAVNEYRSSPGGGRTRGDLGCRLYWAQISRALSSPPPEEEEHSQGLLANRGRSKKDQVCGVWDLVISRSFSEYETLSLLKIWPNCFIPPKYN